MRRSLTVLLTLVCCLAATAPAMAASSTTIYDDCQDNGRIDGHYSQSDYQRALKGLPSDLDEYTDCRDVIRRGQLAAAGGGGSKGSGSSGSGGGGSAGGGGTGGGTSGGGSGAGGGTSDGGRNPLATASAKERQAVSTATQGGAAPVVLGGQSITPGTVGAQTVGGEGHNLPTPVLALLILAAAAVVAGGGSVTWSRVRARGAG